MKKLFVSLLLCIMMVGLVSAFQFDNQKFYNEETKTVTIKNCALWIGTCWIDGEELINAKLTSPLNVMVGVGEDMLVGEFTFKTSEDFLNVFGGLYLEDLKNGKEISRGQQYKYKQYKEISVDDYETICEINPVGNGTAELCEKVEVGNHLETQWEWIPITNPNNVFVPNTEYEIGIFVDTEEGDYGDWKPEFLGKVIDEWATWTGSLNVGLVAYWSFEENTGITSEDVTGNGNDLTGEGTPGWTSSGKIGNSTDLETTGNERWISTNEILKPNMPTTINFWTTVESLDGGAESPVIQSTLKQATGTYRVKIFPGASDFTGGSNYAGVITVATSAITTSNWNMITYIINETGIAMYTNGVITAYTVNASALTGYTDYAGLSIGARSQLGGFDRYYDGKIDEMGFWNRSLTSAEVTQLYNGGTGITYDAEGTPDNPPIVTFNAPTNDYNSTVSTINFNGTASDDLDLINVSFILNNVFNGTNTSGINNTLYNFERILGEGNYTWILQACDNSSVCVNTSQRSIFIDTIIPTITLQHPTGTLGYGAVGQSETLNVTFTDTNLASCWYDYNGTNITIAGCVSGVKNSTTFTLENDKNITIWANDSVGNINGTFYSWDYTVFAIAETYSETAVETSLQNFIINISYNSSNWNSITAKLNYAGTNYSGTQTGTGNTISFSKEIAIGTISVEINNSFYWIFSLTNATASYPILSNSHNQTVSNVTFGICAPTDHPYINFTTKSATNPFPLINATFKSSWDITDASGGSVILNRSFEDLTGTNSSFAFCISPNNTNYTISVDIEIDGNGYAQNYHYITDATVTNVSTTNITLYLLNDSLATLTELQVEDSAQRPLSDVLISIQFYDIGTDTFYTVGMAKTSYNGKDLVYLNWYDTFYKFVLVSSGTTIYTTTPYKISETPQIFTVPSESSFVFDKFNDFEYSLVYNNETQNFVLTFVKPSGDVDAGCLRVIKRNVTNDYTICETCETSSSTTIYCNIAAWGNGTFIASFYATGSFKWIANLFETIGDISSTVYDELGNVGATGIAIIFAGVVASFFFISPVLGVVGILLGSFGAMFLGFQQIDYETFILLSIIGGLVVWKLQK